MGRAIQSRVDDTQSPSTPKLPISQDPDRLSSAARRVHERLSSGRCFKQFVQDERIPRGVAFFMEGGARLDAEACEELIRKGKLRPAGDALFPEASSQTFEAVAR